MRALHHPSLRCMLFFFLFCFLFAARSYVRCPSKLFEQRSHFFKIIPFIQTHTSRSVGFCYPERFKRLSKYFKIILVCSRHGTGKRDAVFIGSQTSFCPDFGSISGIFAYFFPRQAALLSWLHQCCKNSNQYLLFRRTFQGCVSKSS